MKQASTSISLDAVRSAFDAAAPSYDEDFCDSRIGRLQRAAAWRHLGKLFPLGGRLLDLGCGAGEDAVRFAHAGMEVDGIDVAPAMIDAARERAAAEGLSDALRFEALPIEQLDDLPECGYSGAYSSFGPLNCVEDLRPVANALAERLRPGAPVALCLMSRFCLWETLLYPLTATLHWATRHFSGSWALAGAQGETDFEVFYPSVDEVRRAFAPELVFESAPAFGIFLPPTYLEPFAQRFPRVVRALARLDRRVAHWPLLRALGDHRLVILRRR
ncbi:MAG: class I SAM-dependent methyltransferase [Bryobacterales bacterium]